MFEVQLKNDSCSIDRRLSMNRHMIEHQLNDHSKQMGVNLSLFWSTIECFGWFNEWFMQYLFTVSCFFVSISQIFVRVGLLIKTSLFKII